MQNLPRYKYYSYDTFDIQENLISTAENGEIYAVDYGEVDTLSYINGLLTQISFEATGSDSWVMNVNGKCTLYFYFNRCSNSYKSDLSISTLFWRGEYTRISGKVELVTGAFLIEEKNNRVIESELLGEEVIDRIRDFLDEVDEMIELDNIQIRSEMI
mgnify:CR=1 FL=1